MKKESKTKKVEKATTKSKKNAKKEVIKQVETPTVKIPDELYYDGEPVGVPYLKEPNTCEAPYGHACGESTCFVGEGDGIVYSETFLEQECDLMEQIKTQAETIVKLNSQNDDLTKLVASHEAIIKSLNSTIADRMKDIEDYDNKVNSLDKLVAKYIADEKEYLDRIEILKINSRDAIEDILSTPFSTRVFSWNSVIEKYDKFQ